MKRTCNICGTNSDVSEFYRGVTSRCKECHKTRVRENRAANVEYYRAYDAMRFQDDPKVKLRHKRYANTEGGKASSNKSRKKWTANNSDKRSAHVILGNAVRSGKVIKSESCFRCNVSGVRIEGHHSDYSRPLVVEWLCCKCHTLEHKKPNA